jgi:hypothetical protein
MQFSPKQGVFPLLLPSAVSAASSPSKAGSSLLFSKAATSSLQAETLGQKFEYTPRSKLSHTVTKSGQEQEFSTEFEVVGSVSQRKTVKKALTGALES